VSSTNASPAGNRTPLTFNLAEGLTVPRHEVTETPKEPASNASAVVWLGFLGVLSGVWVTRWIRNRGLQPGAADGPPPFSAAVNEQNSSSDNLPQNGEH